MLVAEILSKRIEGEAETFASTDRFRLKLMNGRQLHRLLAGITDFVETGSSLSSRYAEYLQRKGKNGYEIEHIWANHSERHEDEFTRHTDFQEYRNRTVGFLLLPKSFTASYEDLRYAEKREHYLKQNLLAQSLLELAYEPGLRGQELRGEPAHRLPKEGRGSRRIAAQVVCSKVTPT